MNTTCALMFYYSAIRLLRSFDFEINKKISCFACIFLMQLTLAMWLCAVHLYYAIMLLVAHTNCLSVIMTLLHFTFLKKNLFGNFDFEQLTSQDKKGLCLS